MNIEQRDIIVITDSKKGLNRSFNQDDTLMIEEQNYYLFFLFDGVSSLKRSIDFIQMCKNYIIENYKKYFKFSINLSHLMFDTHCFASNKNIYGMSTCSAVYIPKRKNEAYVFNIGDSRIYEYSNQYLVQITQDDSLPGNNSILTKSLGYTDLTINDFHQEQITFKSGLLLCSDGFYHLMEIQKKRYFSILQFKKAGNIKNSIAQIQLGCNKDDSTYIIIRKNGI